MATKRVLKKGVRETLIIIILTIIAVIISISLIKYYTSYSYKLGKLGYTKEEIQQLADLKKEEFALNIGYNDKLITILNSKYYMDKNINRYLDYAANNQDKSIDDVIAIVNVNTDYEFYTNTKETDLSKEYAILVNKYYKLPDGYEPDNIVSISNWYSYAGQSASEEVYNAYKKMFNAAKKEDLTIIINDSYRTLDKQQESWERYGDEYAARAGHSEHNTGLAVDIITTGANSDNFDQTDEFKWLQNHAHEYGFILRYPEGKEYLTGYAYESWHYRYLGIDLATKVYNSGLTYDEYYAYYLEDN